MNIFEAMLARYEVKTNEQFDLESYFLQLADRIKFLQED